MERRGYAPTTNLAEVLEQSVDLTVVEDGRELTLSAPRALGLFLAGEQLSEKPELITLTPANNKIVLDREKEEISIGGLVFPAETVVGALGRGQENKALNRWLIEEQTILPDGQVIKYGRYCVPIYDKGKLTIVRMYYKDYGNLLSELFAVEAPGKSEQRIGVLGAVQRVSIEGVEGKQLQSYRGSLFDGTVEVRMATSEAGKEGNEDFVGMKEFSIKGDPLERALGLVDLEDGMGGHRAGDAASREAHNFLVKVLQEDAYFEQKQDEKEGQFYFRRRYLEGGTEKIEEIALGDDLEGETGKKIIELAVKNANCDLYQWIREQGLDSGTTLVCGLLVGDSIHVANVGDSRAYKEVKLGLKQITKDHSLVMSLIAAGMATIEEAPDHPQRSVIYRCLGDKSMIDVDVSTHKFVPGMRFLFVSDGVTEATGDEYLLLGQRPVSIETSLAKGFNSAEGLVLVADSVRSPDCTDNCAAVEIRPLRVEELSEAQVLNLLADYMEEKRKLEGLEERFKELFLALEVRWTGAAGGVSDVNKRRLDGLRDFMTRRKIG